VLLVIGYQLTVLKNDQRSIWILTLPIFIPVCL